MRLTLGYSRVAMPHSSACPHCGEGIQDWHREWYISPSQERLMYQEKAAADCPVCGGPVYPWQKEPPPIALESLSDVTILRRSRAVAERYCRDQLGVSLESYIRDTEPGKQYEHYKFDP